MQSLAKQSRRWGRAASKLFVLISAAIGAGAQAIGPEIVIVEDPAVDIKFPAVGGSAGGFVTVFNLSTSTRARRLAIDGTPVGPAGGFPLGHQHNQAISGSTRPNAVSRADAVGCVAAWHQLTPTDGDVYAQAVSATSDRVLSDAFTVSDSSADERKVDIACAPWGTCLIVYQRDKNIVGRTLRLRVFTDDFETGDPGAWSGVLTDGCDDGCHVSLMQNSVRRRSAGLTTATYRRRERLRYKDVRDVVAPASPRAMGPSAAIPAAIPNSERGSRIT